MDAPRFDGLPAAFLTIHQYECERDFPAFTLDGIDGLQRGSAGGDDVVYNNNGVARFEIPLDLFAGTVPFGFLANGENLERLAGIFNGGGHADSKRNGIGPESHAADGIDFQVFRVDFRTDRVPTEIADEKRAERIQGRDTAVDVKVALFPGSEGEVAGADGFQEQKFFEIGCGLEHGGMMRVRTNWWKAEKSPKEGFPMNVRVLRRAGGT